MMREYMLESLGHFGKVTVTLLIIWLFSLLVIFVKSLAFYTETEIREEAAIAAAAAPGMMMCGRPYQYTAADMRSAMPARKPSFSASRTAYREAVQLTKILGTLLLAIIVGVWLLLLL